MSTLPDPLPGEPDEDPIADPAGAPQEPQKLIGCPGSLAFGGPGRDSVPEEVIESQETSSGLDQPPIPYEPPPHQSYFETYARQPLAPPRFPNVIDLVMVGFLLILGFLCAGALTSTALHYHLFGVRTIKQAQTDIHYTLGSQIAWYLFTFIGCISIFPLIWHTSFFQGVEWRAGAARHLRWKLFSAAFACFILAIIDGLLMPGPKEAPIDEVFRMPGAAWLLFAFGITLAPFFEELGFRGFLLPAVCTAWDWSVERIRHLPPRERDAEGKVQWSLPAMVVASLLTSIPFALMHGEQTGYSFGPFILLVCVSLVLCWVRLSTRSLAASTLVHASYNLLLFSLMIAASGGFKHLDKI
jgi:hypothetical protein